MTVMVSLAAADCAQPGDFFHCISGAVKNYGVEQGSHALYDVAGEYRRNL